MNSCPTGKRGYLSYELAEEALIGAHVAYNYVKGSGPVGVYQCDDCGQYHLTSKGTINKRLDQMLKDGTLKKNKEANWWEQKWKGK